MATEKNNSVATGFDKKLHTEQQLYHRLDVLLCCGVPVAYK